MPQLVGKKPENTDAFMEEILNYLTQDSDPSAVFMSVSSW